MTDDPRPGARVAVPLSRLGPWLPAIVLFAVTMLAARSFAAGPGNPLGPGPGGGVATAPPAAGPGGIPDGPYTGPRLEGVFVNCSPACDLIVATEGAGLRLTFTDRTIDESSPSLSPDGSQVAFRCGEPGVEPGGTESPRPEGPGSICLVGTETPTTEDATPPPVTTLLTTPDVDYGSPAWSPDGTTIAFDYRDADGIAGIGVWNLESGRPTSISDPTVTASKPTWSPDGRELAFSCGVMAMPGGYNAERFCTMAPDGTNVRQLGGPDGSCGAPTYAPDAVHLGVVCVVPGAEGGGLFFLALAEPMTHSITGDQPIAPEGQKHVDFSPDGRYVYVRRGDALWALEPLTETWSVPAMPPLHGDFDVRALP